jgi:predicted CXXCH cytochrome family protein
MLSQTNIFRWVLLVGGGLMGLQIGCDSQYIEYTVEDEESTVFQNSLTPMDMKQMQKTRHQVVSICRQCHASGSSFRSQSFIKPIPQLCFGCHEDHSLSKQYVHGPVAVGACLFCHRPHVSTYEHLLKVSQPRLCTRCHDTKNYPLSEIHLKASDQLCTECHDPHASQHPLFLKK